MHRAVMALGLLLALIGALFWVIGGPPVAASAGAVVAGLVIAIAGWWLGRRRSDRARAHEEPPAAREPAAAEPAAAQPATAPVAVAETRTEAPVEPQTLPWDTGAVPETVAPSPVADTTAEPATDSSPATAPATPAELDAEAAREAELHDIAEGLRGLKGKGLDLSNVPEWTARIEAWVDADLEAKAARGEEVSPQAAAFMRDFGEIPRDWRRHLLRHLRRLGYRRYQEGEW